MLAGRATEHDWRGDMDERDDVSYEVEGEERLTPVGPGAPTTFDATTLDFGHHAGRTVVELAQSDPDYLRWLARHPSGVRYRAEIARVLDAVVPRASDWER
jgi:uncharacterized protein (DUF3820 family)